MFHLVVSTHELCMYHSGLVDVFSCGRFETREQAEKKAKEVIKETKYDIQRQMNRAKEGMYGNTRIRLTLKWDI